MVIANVQKKMCQVPDCASAVLARGYCCKHYYQVKRNGAVGVRIRRRLSVRSGGLVRPPPSADAWVANGRAETRCSLRGCQGVIFDQRLCRLHFIKMRYLGLTGASEAIEPPSAERADRWNWLEENLQE